MELITHVIDFIVLTFQFVFKIDVYLEGFIRDYGVLTYGILFAIVFCETGLVITPILPGDSLLFAAGAMAGRGLLDAQLLVVLFVCAAVSGDCTNYAVGKFFGQKLFSSGARFLKKEYLDRTHAFYEKYGTKTIIFCRFVPIVRTFAPFVAGLGKMNWLRYVSNSIIGSIAWAGIFVTGGYFFGNLEAVRKSLTLLIIGIIFISVIPMAIEMVKGYLRNRAPSSTGRS